MPKFNKIKNYLCVFLSFKMQILFGTLFIWNKTIVVMTQKSQEKRNFYWTWNSINWLRLVFPADSSWFSHPLCKIKQSFVIFRVFQKIHYFSIFTIISIVIVTFVQHHHKTKWGDRSSIYIPINMLNVITRLVTRDPISNSPTMMIILAGAIREQNISIRILLRGIITSFIPI